MVMKLADRVVQLKPSASIVARQRVLELQAAGETIIH